MLDESEPDPDRCSDFRAQRASAAIARNSGSTSPSAAEEAVLGSQRKVDFPVKPIEPLVTGNRFGIELLERQTELVLRGFNALIDGNSPAATKAKIADPGPVGVPSGTNTGLIRKRANHADHVRASVQMLCFMK